MDANERLSKATIRLMRRKDSIFISTLVLSLDFILDDSVPTACTNGIEIRFNPDFVSKLSNAELEFVIAHEAWHVAFMHMCRKGSRDTFKWNVACDYAINYMLKHSKFELIPGVLYDPQYANMSSEEIYNALPDDPDQMPENPQDGDFKNDGEGEGEGSGSSSGDSDGNDEGSGAGSNKSQVERKVEDAIIKAATAAQMSNQAGNIPGDIAKMVDDILNPKLPWNVILRNYMSAKLTVEKSWTRRNKRFRSVYMPGKLSEGMGNVNIYVDASGSVSNAEFSAYITEMQDIRESLRPQTMKVISFDTDIKEEFVMEKGEEIDVKFTGGGGTHLECVCKHAEQEEEKPDVTIIFTDGYFNNQDFTRLGTDIIWVIVNNEGWTNDIGRIIHYEFKG